MLYGSFLQTYCFKEAVSREEPYISMVQSTLKTPQLFLSYNSDKQKNTRLRLAIPRFRVFHGLLFYWLCFSA